MTDNTYKSNISLISFWLLLSPFQDGDRLYNVVISLESFVFSIIKYLITLENYLVWTIIISL